MKCKNLSGAFVAALLSTIGSAAFGIPNTVIVDRIGNDASDTNGPFGSPLYGGISISGVDNDTTQGGEFTIIPTDTTLLNNYSSSAKVPDPNFSTPGNVGFESFCLETAFTYPSLPTGSLGYSIGPTIINNPSETLAVGVSWLYSQFAAGTLAGYDYTDVTSNGFSSPRATDAAYLQAAIWFLEGQTPFTTAATAGGSANPFLNLLTSPSGLDLANLGDAMDAATTDQYGVEVINIGTSPGFTDQAELVLTDPTPTPTPPPAVPDGGATVMMLGLAAGGIALLRHKLAAA